MLSIDCEGCEWSAFEQMARDPRALKILSGVELLLLDAHFSPSMVPPTLAQVRVCMRRLSLQSICVSTLWECQELRAAHYGASLGYLCSHVTHVFGARPHVRSCWGGHTLPSQGMCSVAPVGQAEPAGHGEQSEGALAPVVLRKEPAAHSRAALAPSAQ